MRPGGFRLLILFIFCVCSFAVRARDAADCETRLARALSPQEQWLEWEETANVEEFIQSTAEERVPLIEVPAQSAGVWTSPAIRPEVKKMFLRDGTVAWPKHMFNQDKRVPHFGERSTQSIPVRLTASRSVVAGPNWISIKMPTDHPHGPKRAAEPEKVDLSEDIRAAIIREEHIQRVDRKLGKDPSLILLPEVMAVSDRVSGNGFLIRDLSPLNDGNYYLPATSIPIVGREIALRNGVPFEKFWKTAFAEALGRAKAKLLLRYGLEMETPNAQNFLIQLDRDLKPTGAIVIRDTADSDFIRPVAEALGFQGELAADSAAGFSSKDKVFVNWGTTHFRFNESRDSAVSSTAIDFWGAAHDDAYVNEVETALKVRLRNKSALPEALAYWKEFLIPRRLPDEFLNDFFQSSAGRTALERLSRR